MATLFLVRHGMTDAAGKQLVGWTPGVHLNAEGRAQVTRLAEYFRSERFAAVYSSPLERALETAQAIAATAGIAVQIRDELGEVRFGRWTGKHTSELEHDAEWRAWNERRDQSRIPGGESMLEIQSRMIAELLRMACEHGNANIGIVSHGDPIRAAIAYFLGAPLASVTRIEVAPASISVVRVESWGIQVLGVNHAA